MASSADDVLYLDLTETQVDAANNRSLVHWKVRFYCGYGVNASQTGNAYVNGALVWNYAGNPGYMTYGNTYTLAEGDIWIGHDGNGDGTASGTAHLQTNTSGQAWSFNKNASNSIGLTHITLVSPPGAPVYVINTALGQDAVHLEWTWGATNGGAVDKYALRVWTDGASLEAPNIYANEVTATSADIGGLWPSTRYYWSVAAHNSAGWGPWSNYGTSWWIDTLSGAWVKVAGSWRMAKVWVRAGGVWRVAKVWKRVGGTWRA